MFIEEKKYLKLLGDYERHCAHIAKATAININESPQAKQKRIIKLEKDYVSWFEYHFGGSDSFAKVKCAWFHEQGANDLINNTRINLLAEIYRSGAKSVHFCMGIPLYLYLVKHEIKYMLLIGETDPKAAELLAGIQVQLLHNKSIKNDYGEKFQHGSWAQGNFTTTDGVRFRAMGFTQNPRGAREQADRPDYIVVDDIDSKAHVENDKLMREAEDKITEDIWGCFDAADDAKRRFVYCNNNFHSNSITNRMHNYFTEAIQKQKESTHKISVVFKILKVCAVKNLHTFEPEWPEKASADYWRELFNIKYRSFMREYMHVHIQDGAIFKNENIKYTSPARMASYEALHFRGDLSYKDQGDYKAMVLVGKLGREFHILLTYLRQSSRAECARWLYDVNEKFGLQRFNIGYSIDGLFAQDQFVNDFHLVGDQRGYYLPVVADTSPPGNKYDNIESLSGFFENDMVLFNGDYRTPDQQTLIDQFLAFEKGSKAHDDGPDATYHGITKVNRRSIKNSGDYAFGARVDNHF